MSEVPHPTVAEVTGLALRRGQGRHVARALPEEVPVAIVCNGTTQAVMMASPVDLEDFALGFALSEGFITDPAQIERLEIADHAQGIEARLWLDAERAEALAARRRAMAGPVGCGLCGIDSLDQATRPLPHLPAPGWTMTPTALLGAAEALRAHQPIHDRTLGVHAAGFVAPDGTIRLAREDVGRHNALDKLIGALRRAGIDPAGGAVVMTSRLSMELVQKTVVAGVPVLAAVSVPTGYAVRLAEAAGLTLVGCARGGGLEVFTHPARIETGESDVA